MSRNIRAEATAAKTYQVHELHPCAMCAAPTGPKHFCHGCRGYVCATCDQTGCEGPHKLVDHKAMVR